MEKHMMQITYLPVSELRYFKDNLNSVAGSKLSDLIESIRSVGIKEPLIVVSWDDKYVVVDGNHRLAIAEQLGIAEVPCVIREMPKEEWFREHVLLNYFRGEVQLQKLIGYITRELDSGVPVKKLAELLQMREHWVIAHYEMGKVKSNEELWKQCVNSYLVKVPVLIKGDMLQKLFFRIGYSMKGSMIHYLNSLLCAEQKALRSLKIGADGNFDNLTKLKNHCERKILLYKNLLLDVRKGRRTDEVLGMIIENMEMADFSMYLGDVLVENLRR